MKTTPEGTPFGLVPGQTLLAIHAHPDDFEMFNSAAAEQAMQQGAGVIVAVATRGEATTLNFETPNWPPSTPIKDIRSREAKQAFAEQKIPGENQTYYNLPDGGLSKSHNRLRLGWQIARTMLKHRAAAVVTPGEQGVDGHNDHVAVHRTTLFVARLLRRMGRDIAVWAATAGDIYDEVVDVDEARKKMLVQLHASQFPEDRPELFDRYRELLRQEKYIRVL